MKRVTLILTILLSAAMPRLHAASLSVTDTLSLKSIFRSMPQFIATEGRFGSVLPTNDYISRDGGPRRYGSMALKYGMGSTGDRWQDIAFGMPYGGLGVMAVRFSDCAGSLGEPIAIYAFAGGQFTRLSNFMTLNYEWNLGMSFNWTPYDPISNPLNIAIGSTVNVYVAATLYLRFELNRALNLDFGLNLTHSSNGDSRQPNYGVNLAAFSVSLVNNFNHRKMGRLYNSCPAPPPFRPTRDQDIMFVISSRQAQIDTTGTGLPSPYLSQKFPVLGFCYDYMINNNYKYKWGPALDLIYDVSSGVKAWREYDFKSGLLYDRVQRGPVGKRFSLGIAAHGEINMERYTLFANLGWNAIWGNRTDSRLYQVIGLKIYLKENLFGTFGVRVSNFHDSQFLYWSLGYTLSHDRKK